MLFMMDCRDAEAGLLSRLLERKSAGAGSKIIVPAGVQQIKDIPYGPDKRQTLDVYTPANAHNAPIIFMVHGGAWKIGSKDVSRVVNNKIARWVPEGFIFVSVNYRMLPDAKPLEQAQDVTKAIAAVQAKAAAWGGDPAKVILMGHSAGAHIVALISASPETARSAGAQPWLGSVLLDSGAMNVSEIMNTRHYSFYDEAFGKDPAYWDATSPLQVMNTKIYPVLAVCSTKRDISCKQAQAFVDKAVTKGTHAQILEVDLKHGAINSELGTDGDYTKSVEHFMGSLDSTVLARLTQ